MRTYSLSLCAHKPADPLGQGWLIGHAATFCWADDKVEALKIGELIVRALWPPADDWQGHDVQIALQPATTLSESRLLIGIPRAHTAWVRSDEDEDESESEAPDGASA